MNTVKVIESQPKQTSPMIGSLYRRAVGDSDVYILGATPKGYVAIALDTGGNWNGVHNESSEAVKGLVLVCNKAEFTITTPPQAQ